MALLPTPWTGRGTDLALPSLSSGGTTCNALDMQYPFLCASPCLDALQLQSPVYNAKHWWQVLRTLKCLQVSFLW